MRKLIEKLQYGMSFHGGVPSGGAPTAPDVPPPPPPVPTKTDEDVEQEKKEALERKKMATGKEDTLLKQTGSKGTTKKKALLGA